jgi:hypothetical protein
MEKDVSSNGLSHSFLFFIIFDMHKGMKYLIHILSYYLPDNFNLTDN